jgi:hypothetical protein
MLCCEPLSRAVLRTTQLCCAANHSAVLV